MSAASPPLADGIAIIGLAGKFPGAPNLEVFWQNLRQGIESITHFSPEELELPPLTAASLHNLPPPKPVTLSLSKDQPPAASPVPQETSAEKSPARPSDHTAPPFVPARALLNDVDLFDAAFFNMNPREADYTDPQHRLLLETAWEALENAGYDSRQFPGSIGVFAGCSLNSYLLHNLSSNPEFLAEFLASQQMGAHPSLLGNDKDFLATRLAYKLDLRGPAITIQSACSTSLVAICQACQNLLTYQCDLALAGGVSVTFPQKRGYSYEEGGIVSRDGRCRPFDATADGTVFGDGVGLVVLKRADEAIRDGDHIHAIIRGFAVNNDGSNKVSYMAPGIDGQADAIAAAQALAGVDVSTIGYVEAHGTGTALGDPIEVAALTRAFRLGTDAKQFCALGGLKGNIGHLEVAAGVAGLIKAVLALEHGEIPPTLHFAAPNPRIDFAASPFFVASHLQPFPATGAPRRAGVSSFGVGGTNAHLVLEQAPEVPAAAPIDAPQLLVLSAKTPTALAAATRRLARHLELHPDTRLPDLAHTLQVGRRAFPYRRALVARTSQEALKRLYALSELKIEGYQAKQPAIAFLFPGQGAQQPNMARDLYDHEPTFRSQVDLCSEILLPQLGLDLRQILYPPAPSDPDRLTQTSLAQPALFAVEYALAQTWLARGVRPQVMLGHSLGEYVAAVIAGIFSLPDALHLLAIRGRLMQSLPPGSLLAVALPESEVLPLLHDSLSLAAVNGPRNCVVSGPPEAVTALRTRLEDQGVAARELNTSHAFHSAMMDPILAEFENEVRQVPRHQPKIPIVSSLYGRIATPAEWTDPAYWSAQLRHTVRFTDALGSMMSSKDLVLLEVGPGQTLSALARQSSLRKPDQVITHSCSRTREETDSTALLTATGQLWAAGVEMKWSALPTGTPRRRVELPPYPFERQRHWIEPTRKTRSAPRNLGPISSIQDPSFEERADFPLDLEALIDEQLLIMTKQIEVLRAPISRAHKARR
jgi:phthiocerol/phenolphthiocerol synthesis type-I polyketide synthase E